MCKENIDASTSSSKEMWDEGDEIKNIHQYCTTFHHNNLEKQG